jgi:hypothetical protein
MDPIRRAALTGSYVTGLLVSLGVAAALASASAWCGGI